MGFEGYFLIVRDFVNAAENIGVMTGCRGSAAGSLVAYAIGITDVDPIKFDLLFERFLNPERIDMPDADIDFADRDRHKIIEYVIDKYGRDSVSQIINFGRMKAKMVVRDVARVMGISVAEAGKLAGMVDKDLDTSLSTQRRACGRRQNQPEIRGPFPPRARARRAHAPGGHARRRRDHRARAGGQLGAAVQTARHRHGHDAVRHE